MGCINSKIDNWENNHEYLITIEKVVETKKSFEKSKLLMKKNVIYFLIKVD